MQCYATIPSNCGTEWVHSTTLLRPLFYEFSLSGIVTYGIESEGIGARSVRSPLRLRDAQPARENMGIELGAISMYATGLTLSTI